VADKSSLLLTPEQRLLFTAIPEDLPENDLIRYYTLTPEDLTFIKRHHGSHNRLGIALQLCILRYLGRALTDVPSVPERVIVYVAQQLGLSPTAFARYGQRTNTLYEHLARLRQQYGYRNYGWSGMLQLTRHLLPLAMESDDSLPLVEEALAFLRAQKVIAPGITTTERLAWRIQKIARQRVYGRLTKLLTTEQAQLLDKLLCAEKDKGNVTPLAWLRLPTKKPSSRGMYHLLERIAYLKQLQLPKCPPNVHPNRVRQLARHCRYYQAQPLAKFGFARRYAYLMAYLNELQSQLSDQLLDMFDRWQGDLMRRGRNAQKHHLYKHVTVLNRTLNTLAKALSAFLEAKEQASDPFEAVFAVVDEAVLMETLNSAQETMRPPDMDFRDLLENRYTRRRKAMLQMYRALSFQAVAAKNPTLEALDYVVMLQDQFNQRVRGVEQVIKKQTMTAPLEHLKRTKWKRHALKGETINPNYYEMAAWQRLKEGLRAGDIAVAGSRRYREFDSYLLSQEEWQQLQETDQTRLAISDDVQAYLQERQQRIEELLTQLEQAVAQGDLLTLDADGILHLKALQKSTPDEAIEWRRKLYNQLPLMQLAEVVIEVDGWTDFLKPFTHLTSGQRPVGEQKTILVAALMGLGMNLGLAQMAQATAFSYRQLAWIAEWYIRPETLRQALAELDNFVLHHPFSRHWGQGSTSSSDGMRIVVPVEAANAMYNARYFGFKRGVTIVTHAADIWMPFEAVVSKDASEALHVIDALCHHETDFDILEHHTDTGGYTYHVFALCMMLGFRFRPRIRAMAKQYLFTVEPVTIEPALQHLVKGQVDIDLIKENWAQMRRLAASIRHGTVSASLIMRKLASYPRQNQLAKAFNEIGKLERTVFVLEYLLDQSFQQQIRRALNKGEAIHSLARALTIGQAGELYEREVDAQMNRASSLMLLVSTISAWNTVYLDKVVAALQAEGLIVPSEYLPHTSPLGWEHINFFGKYDFDLEQTYPLDNLRPLRKLSIDL
jgi:TnpA family transposase/uncharacterized protein YukE